MNEHEQIASGGSEHPPAGGGRGGVGGWIVGVFADPKRTFGQIADVLELPHRTDPSKTRDGSKWWMPFLVALIVTGGIAAYTVPKIVMPERMADVRAAMVEQGAPPEDIDRAMELSGAIGTPAGILGAVVVTAIIFFIVAGLLHLFAKMVGGKGRFRHARAVAAYGMLITSLGSLVKLPMMISKKTMLVSTGPAILMGDVEPSNKLYLFLHAGFDIFTIWWVVVLLFGMAIAYRISKAKAGIAVGLIWLIFTVLGTLGEGGAIGG